VSDCAFLSGDYCRHPSRPSRRGRKDWGKWKPSRVEHVNFCLRHYDQARVPETCPGFRRNEVAVGSAGFQVESEPCESDSWEADTLATQVGRRHGQETHVAGFGGSRKRRLAGRLLMI
jgi:hypothetical protein